MDLGETVGKILIFCNVPQQPRRPPSPPSLEELWKEMDVALWEGLPPAERAKIEAENKADVGADGRPPASTYGAGAPSVVRRGGRRERGEQIEAGTRAVYPGSGR